MLGPNSEDYYSGRRNEIMTEISEICSVGSEAETVILDGELASQSPFYRHFRKIEELAMRILELDQANAGGCDANVDYCPSAAEIFIDGFCLLALTSGVLIKPERYGSDCTDRTIPPEFPKYHTNAVVEGYFSYVKHTLMGSVLWQDPSLLLNSYQTHCVKARFHLR